MPAPSQGAAAEAALDAAMRPGAPPPMVASALPAAQGEQAGPASARPATPAGTAQSPPAPPEPEASNVARCGDTSASGSSEPTDAFTSGRTCFEQSPPSRADAPAFAPAASPAPAAVGVSPPIAGGTSLGPGFGPAGPPGVASRGISTSLGCAVTFVTCGRPTGLRGWSRLLPRLHRTPSARRCPPPRRRRLLARLPHRRLPAEQLPPRTRPRALLTCPRARRSRRTPALLPRFLPRPGLTDPCVAGQSGAGGARRGLGSGRRARELARRPGSERSRRRAAQ